MPTAATAQILGNNESFEPYTSNMYVRRVLSGEFQVRIEYLSANQCFTLFEKVIYHTVFTGRESSFVARPGGTGIVG